VPASTAHRPRTIVAGLLLSLTLMGCSATPPPGSPQPTVPDAQTPAPGQTVQPGQPDRSPLPGPTDVSPPTEAVIPPPPAAMPAPAGSVEERAAAFVAAISPEGDSRAAAWLTLYDALGIPVLDDSGAALGSTGDDPIGPRYWRVWYTAALTQSDIGFSLEDFVGLFGLQEDGLDVTSAAEALLADLRAGLSSDDPRAELLAHVIAELVATGPLPADIRDESLTAAYIHLPVHGMELLTWAVVRDLMFALAPTEDSWAGLPTTGVWLAAARPADVPGLALPPSMPKEKCSEAAGGEELTYWLNWIMNKLGGGLSFGPLSTKGFVEIVQEHLGTSKSKIEKTKKATSAVNAVASLITLLMQLEAMKLTATMSPDPVKRERRAGRDGDEATITFELRSDPKVVDGDQTWACLTSFVLNAFGVNLGRPPNEAISGAGLRPEGKRGFGDYVLFRDASHRQLYTDANGKATVAVIGKARTNEVDKNAREMRRTFTIHVSAQPGEVTGKNLFEVFFAGFSFGWNPGSGGNDLLSGALEVAKTMHWSVGDHDFSMIDYEPAAYQFDFTGRETFTSPLGPGWIRYHYQGLLCPGEERWRIWETIDGEELATYQTQVAPHWPQLATFDAAGHLRDVEWGLNYPNTIYGTWLKLVPGDDPREIVAHIPVGKTGDQEIVVTAPIFEADGTLDSCE
jgi:hypothetical protein